MNNKALIFILFISILVSCEKELGDKTWAYYRETQCANAWDNISANSTEAKVTEYLESKGIEIFDIKIERYSYGPFCTACFCASGRTIRVLVLESDLDSILDLGFKE
jgi:hypothetical protein